MPILLAGEELPSVAIGVGFRAGVILVCFALAVSFVSGYLGDLNGDSTVNAVDFSLAVLCLEQSASCNPAADVRQDGRINLFDLVKIGNLYGTVYSSLGGSEYTNPKAVFAEPAVPNVQLNGEYTTFGNVVTRLTDSSTVGGSAGLSHWYVDRSPMNSDGTWVVAVNPSGGWVLLPITITGAFGSETIRSGPGVSIPFGGPNQPSTVVAGLWDPNNGDVYWVTAGFKLWKLAPSTMTWTLVRDFTPDVPNMSSYTSITCPWTGTGNLFLGSISPDSEKLLFHLNKESKNSFGTLLYNVKTDTIIRFDTGTAIVNPAPVPTGPPNRYNGGGTDKSFTYLLQQMAGSPCSTGGSPKQYVINLHAGKNLFGTVDVPSYSLTWAGAVAHGVVLSGAVAMGGDANGWYSTSSPSGFTWYSALRRYDLTSVHPATGYESTIPFAWYDYSSSGLGGFHYSNNMLTSDRWVFMSAYQDLAMNGRVSTLPLANELVAIDMTRNVSQSSVGAEISGENILRLGHHYSYVYAPGPPGSSYWAQPHASTDFSGRFLFFGSTLGPNSGRYDLFVVRLPVSVRS